MKSLILFLLALSVTAICFAQSNYTESLTITTYYPAPYGVYRDLIARKSFAVGNFSSTEVQNLNPGQLRVKNSIAVGNLTASDVSDLQEGQLYVKGGLRIGSRTGPSTGWAIGKEGEVAYYSGDLYVCNGTAWIKVTGGSTTPTPTPTTTPTPRPTQIIECNDNDAACMAKCVGVVGYYYPSQTVVPGNACGYNGIYHNCCNVCTTVGGWTGEFFGYGSCQSGRDDTITQTRCIPTTHSMTKCTAYY